MLLGPGCGLIYRTCTPTNGVGNQDELGGVLIWCSLGASPSHRKLSTGQLRQVAHRRAVRERTSTPSILIMGLGCPQGVPF